MQIDPCLAASPCPGIYPSDGGHHFLKMKLTSTLWFLHLCWHFILLPWNPSSLITVNVFSKRSSINRTTRHCAELLFTFQRPFPVSSSKLPFKTRGVFLLVWLSFWLNQDRFYSLPQACSPSVRPIRSAVPVAVD